MTQEDGGECKVCLQAGEVGLAQGLVCLGRDSGRLLKSWRGWGGRCLMLEDLTLVVLTGPAALQVINRRTDPAFLI